MANKCNGHSELNVRSVTKNWYALKFLLYKFCFGNLLKQKHDKDGENYFMLYLFYLVRIGIQPWCE